MKKNNYVTIKLKFYNIFLTKYLIYTNESDILNL